ncbi:MAG: DNA polymerase ligase N-terminal domain-containing protein [Patescibacteria group bacterium]
MSLKKYQQKRKFAKTPEPKGKEIKKSLSRFVIHKHRASHLHWDLRLELDGVLKSWAVPKEPPVKTGIKRLAVRVEDHPVGYIDFKGTIPKGNYGAGQVEIWDQGKFSLLNRSINEISFLLSGRRLKGRYLLIKPKGSRFGRKAWLFFKRENK